MTESIDLERDASLLVKELIKVGRLAGTFVSRAAMQGGHEDPVTAMFDEVAQSLTVTLLKLQHNLALLDDEPWRDRE